MMSKRNLYPSISKVGNYSQNIKDRMNFIAYCDGRNIFEISLKTGIKLEKLIEEYKILNEAKVLKRKFEKKENL
jgi:aminopeptidase-like protein